MAIRGTGDGEGTAAERPSPAEKTVANMVTYHQFRYSRWREWFAKYPLAEGFQVIASVEAVEKPALLSCAT